MYSEEYGKPQHGMLRRSTYEKWWNDTLPLKIAKYLFNEIGDYVG